ncbi:hypothetical protein [Mycoplasmopsis edwardii]|uniref:Uncharacterized protein n=1 Tax=Mycoplasmopsis edwardii TaxID=53558 RepID=A0ACD4PGY0_9BACT|nr:hypothetical protein [Mycoplasmopsis edwardii]WBP83912.1 hypothetical protein Me_995_000540 [Mycoplasmopsis edwardii]
MKKKLLFIQILFIKNILNIFTDLEYPTVPYSVEEYCENLFDTVSPYAFAN